MLLTLPLETFWRIVDRRPAIEIHRLKKDVPGEELLTAKINRLFPDLKWDDD
jgi:hypothetical protein